MAYETLTEDAVRDTALKLIAANGQTTNLDIKHDLWNQKYWAEQADVAGYMDAIEGSGAVVSSFNGQYRTFYDPATGKAADPAAAVQGGAGIGVTPTPFQSDTDDDEDDDAPS